MCIVLLILPAAYHRIAERGEDTGHFHRLASRCVTAAWVPLSAALALDVYVIVERTLGSRTLGVASAVAVVAVVVVTLAAWFGLTLTARRTHAGRPPRARLREAEA